MAPKSLHLQSPSAPGTSRSRSSGSSTSSLSSTFSDITSSTSNSSSSPPASKTSAFFASPFSTRPPSPTHQIPHTSAASAAKAPRSLTADFFATPVRPPSPPASSTPGTSTRNSLFTSRIFPSRYTSTGRRSPELQLLNFHESPPSNHQRTSSSGSDSSLISSPVDIRLPTPPPPAPLRMLRRDDTVVPSISFEADSNQSTPRPPDLEPTLLHFERSLLFAAQAKQNAKPEPEPEPPEDEEVEEEPHAGSLILLPRAEPPSPLPLSPLSMTFTLSSSGPPSSGSEDRETPTPTPSNDSPLLKNTLPTDPSSPPTSASTHSHISSHPTLRLTRPLGHGAFSSVWLAEDLSRVPLTLVSKKSVRDLRRRASGRVCGREIEKPQEETEAQPGTSAPNTLESNRRPPSRLREGLRNMLSFTRLPAASLPTSPKFPTSPSADVVGLAKNPTLMSPNVEPGPLSRHPSFRSSTSTGSDLSRNSSIRSTGAGPSSNALSLRLPIGSDTTPLSRDSSLKKFRERVRGTRPGYRLGRSYLDERHGEMGEPRDGGSPLLLGDGLLPEDGAGMGMSLSRQSSFNKDRPNGRLVAVKMTPRKVRGDGGRREKEEEERTRVGFVREVEVLKHISHPNITPLLAHLSTSSHHILVLPYLPGGDLLGLVNSDVAWGKLGESVLRRIWCELCKAVGWMHGVGLVHRDIKLENILLTTPVFSSLTPSSPPPTLSSLPLSPAPLIKLTDFGLSRFVEIDANGDAELLSTRCGSEAYAAPELVIGGRGVYDARKTDAWACGVVLYALAGRQLPFGEGVSAEGQVGVKIGGERETGRQQSGAASRSTLAERRQWLIRIARGEWTWPGDEIEEDVQEPSIGQEPKRSSDAREELIGAKLVKSKGARRVVSRLLVRDPRKRARIGDIWDDVWMCGGEDEGWWRERERESAEAEVEGHCHSPDDEEMQQHSRDHDHVHKWIFNNPSDIDMRYSEDPTAPEGEDLALEDRSAWSDDDGELEDVGGCLLDQEGIDSITRQEVV